MTTLDEMTLRRMYHEERLSIRAIADALGLNYRTIYDALMRWKIPRRPRGLRTIYHVPTFAFDEATLRHLYLDAGHTIKEIAVTFQVAPSAVWSAMEYWQIPRRRRGPRHQRPL
jgi:hypothetical protein